MSRRTPITSGSAKGAQIVRASSLLEAAPSKPERVAAAAPDADAATASPETPSSAHCRAKPDPDPRRKALELLVRREHSQRELTRKLVGRGFSAGEAEAAVGEMAERGWQDDGRYAEVLARNRANNGFGPVRIRAELRTHGLDERLVDAALEACEMDWGQSAREQLQKRFGNQPAVARQEVARRGAFLQRRGFGLDDIRRALSQDFGDD